LSSAFFFVHIQARLIFQVATRKGPASKAAAKKAKDVSNVLKSHDEVVGVRRPPRQDERVKALRVMSTKLKMYKPDVLQSIVGKKSGLSVSDYIVEKGFRELQGHIASNFWH